MEKALVGVVTLLVMLAASDGSAQTHPRSVKRLATLGSPVCGGGLIDPQVCEGSDLPEQTDEFCHMIEGLEGRDLFKARVLESLRRTNQPAVARLQLFDRVGEGNAVRPAHVDLDASGSFDPDPFGSVEHYTFQLFDADTGEILGSTVTRQPVGTVLVDHELPRNLRAEVHVADDEGAISTTDLTFTGPETTCSTNLFTCAMNSNGTATECQPTAANGNFVLSELLSAAQKCDPSISDTTPLRIAAWGGSGSRGGKWGAYSPGKGGAGGVAAMGTTISRLQAEFGGTTYCYGLGKAGTFHSSTNGNGGHGSGGASTILGSCNFATAVVVLAGGGGGGGAASGSGNGLDAGAGGIALSPQNFICPDTCAPGSTSGGGGADGEKAGGLGGSGGYGGAGGAGQQNNLNAGEMGENGVGGNGGAVQNTPIANWYQGKPNVSGLTGSGGASPTYDFGGSGGGGYGGGGSGGINVFTARGGGGGGSMAYASRSSYVAPSVAPAGAVGSLSFSFKP